MSEIHMFNFGQILFTFKWDIELYVISLIANVVVSKCRTKWKQIQTMTLVPQQTKPDSVTLEELI